MQFSGNANVTVQKTFKTQPQQNGLKWFHEMVITTIMTLLLLISARLSILTSFSVMTLGCCPYRSRISISSDGSVLVLSIICEKVTVTNGCERNLGVWISKLPIGSRGNKRNRPVTPAAAQPPFFTLTAYSVLVALWMHRLQTEKEPMPMSSFST